MKKLFLISTAVLTLTVAHAQYTKLLDFNDVNGNQPNGSLIYDGTFLYGMTALGGTTGDGVIFKIKPDGTGYANLHNFGNITNGLNPYGSLISIGTFLYGMTWIGGTNFEGTMFKIAPNGTGYSDLYNFIGPKGRYPFGSLISDGTFLYGMTSEGGINNMGVIFKIKPDGTGYADLFDFSGANGSAPNGSLIYDGTFLYGMTGQGGTNNMGTIFKIKPDGTGDTLLHNFSGAANGSYPGADLIYDGTFLYGMTAYGGANNMGTIFKIKPDGTGDTILLSFAGAVNGSNPTGSLISDGTFLYGMTYYGGANNTGTIFKIKPDGTGYSMLVDFQASTTDGGYPSGSLISDGTFLYGMTSAGGINNMGVIFKYALTTGIAENNVETNFSISPNPFSSSATLQTDIPLINATLTVDNCFGQRVAQIKNISGQTIVFNRDNLASGLYFVRLTEENNPDSDRGIAVDKFVIVDK